MTFRLRVFRPQTRIEIILAVEDQHLWAVIDRVAKEFGNPVAEGAAVVMHTPSGRWLTKRS